MSYKDVPPMSRRAVGSTLVTLGDKAYLVSTVRLLHPDYPHLPYETAIFKDSGHGDVTGPTYQHTDEETAIHRHGEIVQSIIRGEVKLEGF